ncbi:MAG: hypothetical protein KBA75_07685 [Alphaproteobacteria bacterium]|nr:hypothetical protein [Alphaproteobacteria bacterium]
MADDLAGMTAQFTGGDVRPRDAGSALGGVLTNSFFPGATPGEGTGATSAMGFGGTGEGAGSSYIAASQRLAQVAAASAASAYLVEKGILANNLQNGNGDSAGQLARLAVINSAMGLAAGDMWGSGGGK